MTEMSGRDRRAAADAARADAQWGMYVLPDDRQSTPADLARAAFNAGHRLFQVDVPISYVQGNVAASLSAASRQIHPTHGDFLGEIESIGWQLQHVSTSYLQTGTTGAGNWQSADHGVLVALYVFRRREDVA